LKGTDFGKISRRLADIGLAGLFVVAGGPKIIDPDSFADAIASYRMTPGWASDVLAYFLPWFELLAAMLLMVGVHRHAVRITLVGLLSAYTVATLVALGRGIDIHCGCFGGDGTSGWHVVGRNTIILLAFGLMHLVGGNRRGETKADMEQ
jgi:uncharacterized membrane protein YphA (DoxX/SURF4 family)